MTEVVDLAALQQRLKGKKNRLVRLAAVFMQYYPGQLEEVAAAISQADAEALYHSAHTFKGTVISFEARRAGALALDLENRGRQGPMEGAAAVLEQLTVEVERLRVRLQELLNDSAVWPE